MGWGDLGSEVRAQACGPDDCLATQLDVVYVGQEQQLAAVVRKHVCTPSAGSTSTSEVAVIVLGEQVQAWVNASANQKSLVFIGPIASSSR